MRLLLSIVLVGGFLLCLTYQKGEEQKEPIQNHEIINIAENTITERYIIPDGFTRRESNNSSFASYLLSLALKDFDQPVRYFDGRIKANHSVYCGVIDMDIDSVDLQQCADAVMRFRAEYLYKHQRFDEIKFNFLSDGKARYYEDYAKGDYSYSKFRKYLKYIFSYANTASLHDELRAVSNPMDIQAGDVFIQKGRPYGHAVIVLDVVESRDLQEKQFLLAQSYMPAQETQILLNPSSDQPSPWYSTKSPSVQTPEWSFEWKDLRRFENVRP